MKSNSLRLLCLIALGLGAESLALPAGFYNSGAGARTVGAFVSEIKDETDPAGHCHPSRPCHEPRRTRSMRRLR